MSFPDVAFTLSIAAFLGTVVTLFFSGVKLRKEENEKKGYRLVPLGSVLILLGAVIFLSNYYTNQLEAETDDYKKLLALRIDSIITKNEDRTEKLDSLEQYRQQLEAVVSKLEKQQQVTGKGAYTLIKARDLLIQTEEGIDKVASYNEIVEPTDSFKKRKGLMTHGGNTSNFQFVCPKLTSGEFIDLHLFFQDKKLVDKIAYIYISVEEIIDKSNTSSIYEQTYKPQKGVNLFKIKNYLKKANTKLTIGYFLKTEVGKEYPTLEKVSCRDGKETQE